MKADTLKKSILQWAIEGKLVPQLESEPTVEQIGETPEDVPFTIPEKWKWVNLSEVVISRDGERRPVKKSDRDNKEKIYDYYGATGIIDKIDSYLFDETLLLVGEDGANLLSRARDNAFIASGKYWVNNHAHVLEPRKTLVAIEYLQLYLSFISLAKYVTGSAQPKLTQKNMMRIPVPLPSVSEQQRIVAKLNEILPLVETYGKEKEALDKTEKEFPDKLRASLLQEAIQGKLVPQLESEPEVTQIGEAPEDVPFAIPEKWRWVRVSDVAHTNPKVTAQTSSTEVSFIPMVALSAGYISQIALDAKRSWGTVKNGYTKFIEGDVLLAKITPCFQNRKSAIAKKLSNGIGCGSSEFHVLRVNENIVTQEYLLMFLKSQWFITYGVENFKGTAGQQRLGTSDLKNCLFPLPPMSEQHRIVAKLNELLDSVKHLEYNVSKT